MKAATLKSAPGPSLAQLVSLTLDMSEAQISRLIDASSDDQDWSEVDYSVDSTTRLILDKVKGMRSLEFKNYPDFISAWIQVMSSIELCARAFSCPNSYYGRELGNLRDYAKQALHTVEFVGMREKLRV